MIRIPEKAGEVLAMLHEAGYEAYAVGGCVRDSLLGREPADWDITTSATPEEVKRVFPRTIDTGIAHGTVTVRHRHESFEVTTYRVDGTYEDHRHPDKVTFTRSLEEDLRRRDFTVNACAYNDEEGLVDLFGALEDLENKVVRCVGNPRDRFNEDALRILRAFRFCAKLGFSLEEGTRQAAEALAPSLSLVSPERIRMELEKLILSPHPEEIRNAYAAGVTKVVLPEFDAEMRAIQNNAHHSLSVGDHTIETLKACPMDRILRWTMLLHDAGKPLVQTRTEDGVYHYHGHAVAGAEVAGKVLRRLRFDRQSERDITDLIRNHSLYPELTEEGVRRALVEISPRLFPLFLAVKRSDILGQRKEVQVEKLLCMDEVEKLYKRILERGDCLSLKALAVRGDDLIEAGIPRGEDIGRVLGALLSEVLQDPERNERGYLLRRAKEICGPERC